MAPMKSTNGYVYTKLNDITERCSSVNLYGLIHKVNQEFKILSSGKMHAVISLVDETSPPGCSFRVSFFLNEAITHMKEGTIIRIHRAKVEKHLNTVDGRVFRSTDVVVFPHSEQIDDFNFVTTAKSIHRTDEDNRRVSELRLFALTKDDSELFAVSQSGRIHFAFTYKNELDEHHDNKNGLQELCQPSVNTSKISTISILDDEDSDSDEYGSFRIKPLNEKKKRHMAIKKVKNMKNLKEDSLYMRNPFSSSLFIENVGSEHPANTNAEDVEHTVPSSLVDTDEWLLTQQKLSKDESSNKTETSPRQSKEPSVEKSNEFLNAACDTSSPPKTSQINGNSKIETSAAEALGSNGGLAIDSHNQHAQSDLLNVKGREMMENSRLAVESPQKINYELVNPFNHEHSHDLPSHMDCTIKSITSLIPSLKHPLEENDDLSRANAVNASKLEKSSNMYSKCATNAAPERSEELITLQEDRSCESESPENCSVWLKKLETPIKTNKRFRKGNTTTVLASLIKKDEVPSSDGHGKVDHTYTTEGGEEDIRKHQESAETCHIVLPSNDEKEGSEISSSKSALQYDLHLSSLSSTLDSNRHSDAEEEEIYSCSTVSISGSTASVECPGLVCARAGCDSSAPIILKDDDPRLHDYDDILFEEVEINNVDMNSDIDVEWSPFESYLPYSENFQVYRVGLKQLKEFKWPIHQTKAQVFNMKPPLKGLQSYGPKNLLSGYCSNCALYHPYSRLKWDKDILSGQKRPTCPNCLKDGNKQYVSLSFRLKLFLKDACGTVLPVLATKTNAASFLDSDECPHLTWSIETKGAPCAFNFEKMLIQVDDG